MSSEQFWSRVNADIILFRTFRTEKPSYIIFGKKEYELFRKFIDEYKSPAVEYKGDEESFCGLEVLKSSRQSLMKLI
jgi:hypothetical protein